MPGFFIWNTALHVEKGEHWVAVYVSDDYKVEFFDSFAHSPMYYGWNLTGDVSYNKKLVHDECMVYDK